jgi:hypothetical protein
MLTNRGKLPDSTGRKRRQQTSRTAKATKGIYAQGVNQRKSTPSRQGGRRRGREGAVEAGRRSTNSAVCSDMIPSLLLSSACGLPHLAVSDLNNYTWLIDCLLEQYRQSHGCGFTD